MPLHIMQEKMAPVVPTIVKGICLTKALQQVTVAVTGMSPLPMAEGRLTPVVALFPRSNPLLNYWS